LSRDCVSPFFFISPRNQCSALGFWRILIRFFSWSDLSSLSPIFYFLDGCIMQTPPCGVSSSCSSVPRIKFSANMNLVLCLGNVRILFSEGIEPSDYLWWLRTPPIFFCALGSGLRWFSSCPLFFLASPKAASIPWPR